MKKLLFAIVLMFFAVIVSARDFAAFKIANSVTIDGVANDWPDSLIAFSDDLNGMTGFVYNDTSLYVMFRFNDRDLARKAVSGGIKLWWQENGKKKKSFAIQIPPQHEPGQMRRMRDPQSDDSFDPRPPNVNFDLVTPLFLEPDKEIKESWYKIAGIAAAAKAQDGFYCFEFCIPFNTGNNYAVTVSPKKEFKIGLEIGGIDKKQLQKMQAEMQKDMPEGLGDSGGGMGGSMGGGMGSGMGGGMRGPGGGRGMGSPGGDMSAMFKATELWFTIKR